MSDSESILITGAGGFIGGWLAETLFLTGSAKVRAGVRSWSSAARLGRFPFEIVLCDVMDVQQIERAMSGATRVIHCAYGSSDVIVQGTRNVLDAARKTGVNRVVHLSTTEVYGNASGQIDETFPYQHTGNPYGDSKIEAERLCWEYCGQGLPVTVIRPPIVYGPFSKWWTVGLAQKLLSGRWGVFEGYGDGICNLVYVADLVSGILLAAHEERAVGEAFNLNGPEPLTWNQYFQRFNAALGLPELNPVKPNTAHLRAAITQPMRDSAYFVLRRFGGPIRRMYQRFARAKDLMQYAERSLRTTARLSDLNLYSREAMYVSGKAREILGYVPRFNVDDGLQLSVRWLQHLGLATPVATGTGGQGESFAVPSG